MSKVGVALKIDAGELRRLFHYNPETGELTRRVNSGTAKAGDVAGTINGMGYRDVRVKSVLHKAHRIAWCIFYGEHPRGNIDHINGDRLDNRIANLRIASLQENARNRRMNRNNKSGVTGVSLVQGKWHAAIKDKPNHQKHLGVFETLAEAAQARKDAEEKYGYHENHGARR